MGNSAGTGRPAPHSPTSRLRLRRGKKIAGCPCFLSEQTLSWEALTTHDKFRGYVLRHLLDEGFICSVLENGEREHMLGACEGVMYYKVSWAVKGMLAEMHSTAPENCSEESRYTTAIRETVRCSLHYSCATSIQRGTFLCSYYSNCACAVRHLCVRTALYSALVDIRESFVWAVMHGSWCRIRSPLGWLCSGGLIPHIGLI